MKDRFLVRYWVKGSKKYLNSNKLVYNDGTYTQVSTKQLPNGKYISYILYDWNTSEVIPEQCTGLKDKNGQLIYEGDIVELDDCELYAVIEWDDETGCWIINTIENTIYTFDNLYGYELTIVGNIHENTELMI